VLFGFFWQANNDPLRESACIACACLIGIDLSTVGVALAQERAATIGWATGPGFRWAIWRPRALSMDPATRQ
jgi:hypothetical protein